MKEAHERVELRTERLLLRPFKLEDVDDVFDYASDAEWARYLPRVPQPYTHKAAEESVARNMLESWETHPTWAIVLNQRVVGGIVLMIDIQHEIGELGYELSREHWGKGLNDRSSARGDRLGIRREGPCEDLCSGGCAQQALPPGHGEDAYETRRGPAEPRQGARRARRRCLLWLATRGVGNIAFSPTAPRLSRSLLPARTGPCQV